jgi:large subunit ribosomal protein L30e
MSKRGSTTAIAKAKRRKRSSKKKDFDINKLVNIAVKTGKTVIGTEAVKKYINISELKLIVFAQNCPKRTRKTMELLINSSENPISVYNYPFSSWDLGTAAGKPFMVACFGIINQGDSGIIEAIQKNVKLSA